MQLLSFIVQDWLGLFPIRPFLIPMQEVLTVWLRLLKDPTPSPNYCIYPLWPLESLLFPHTAIASIKQKGDWLKKPMICHGWSCVHRLFTVLVTKSCCPCCFG